MVDEQPVSRITTEGRRRFLTKVTAGTAAVSMLGLGGCLGEDDNGDDGQSTDEDTNGDDANGDDTSGDDTGDDGADVETVTIGMNHPLTGALSYAGTRMQAAIEMAVEQKNEQGGIESMGGAQIEVLSGDNEGAQELGGQVQQELIDDGADVLIGTFTSPTALAATGVAEQNEVPFVIDVAAADEVMQGQDWNWCYRVQPPARWFGRDYAEYVPHVIRESGGTIDTAGLFIVNNAYGDANLASLQEHLPEVGIEIIEETRYEVGEGTFDTQITRLQNADPDTVIFTGYTQGGITLMTGLQDQEYRPPYLTACGTDTFVEEDTNREIGEFTNGIVHNNFAPNKTLDRTNEVIQRYTEQTGNSLGAMPAMSYAATEVIIQLFEEAGTTDKVTLNQTLKDIVVEDHIMAMPPIEFNDEGENLAATTPAQQVQDYESQIVYPEEFATHDPVIPWDSS